MVLKKQVVLTYKNFTMKKTMLIACLVLHSWYGVFAQELNRSLDSLVTASYEAAEFTGTNERV